MKDGLSQRRGLSCCCVLLVACALAVSSTSQAQGPRKLFRFVRGEKVGFIDHNGKVIIKPQFSSTCSFSEGLACVRRGDGETGAWGFINQSGAAVIPQQFGEARSFSEGLAAVKNSDGQWGYIDKTGALIIKPQFDLAYDFQSGLAEVVVDNKSGRSTAPESTSGSPRVDGRRRQLKTTRRSHLT